MAQNNSGGFLRFLPLGILTIAGGAALGYFVFGGMHSGPAATDVTAIQQPTVPSDPVTAPVPTPPKTTASRLNSDYTAPGAPRIHILEAKTPSLNDSSARPKDSTGSNGTVDSTDIPTPDVEASQQGTPPPAPSAATNTAAGDTGSDSTAAAPSGSSATAPPPPAPPKSTAADPEAGQTGASSAPSPASPPSSPSSHNSGASPTDPENTQTGDTGVASKTGGHTQYRVQAGSFADAGNARDYVSTLHSRGYDADLHSERQGDKTVYKVQVGAYRSRADADQAAADFRRKGVPVTVSSPNP